jgi:hypothetical protein
MNALGHLAMGGSLRGAGAVWEPSGFVVSMDDESAVRTGYLSSGRSATTVKHDPTKRHDCCH